MKMTELVPLKGYQHTLLLKHVGGLENCSDELSVTSNFFSGLVKDACTVRKQVQ